MPNTSSAVGRVPVGAGPEGPGAGDWKGFVSMNGAPFFRDGSGRQFRRTGEIVVAPPPPPQVRPLRPLDEDLSFAGILEGR
jgi:hypothetical protein